MQKGIIRNKQIVPVLCAALAVLCIAARACAQAPITHGYYNVMDYGASKDSSRPATGAIAKAIAAAVKAGGGTVYFPAGKYLTGPIRLRSNITLLIDAGAELDFSDQFGDYLPMVPSRWEGTNVVNFSPLFYAYKDSNIAIEGRGVVNGNGKKWWAFALEQMKDKGPVSRWGDIFHQANKGLLQPDDSLWLERGFLRPPFIQFVRCSNIRIKDITLKNSPFWTVNPEYCENVTVTGITIRNPKSPNTDGINAESCKYVHISDCHISVGDDCITIKSGKDRDGRNAAAPAEDYTITNCTMLSGHGGVVIGSEMSGGVRRIVISNCVFDGTDRGIRIKTARGRGGVVEDIRVDNIVMHHIGTQAIVLDMQYSTAGPEPVSERTPRFRNIHFSNITGDAATAGLINGLEEMPVEDVTFDDLQLTADKGFTVREARNVAFHHVLINARTGPALSGENIDGLELDGVTSHQPLPKVPVIRLDNVDNAYIHNCWAYPGTDRFLQVQGPKTGHITAVGNNLKDAVTPVSRINTSDNGTNQFQ
jgi:polygalacturonase